MPEWIWIIIPLVAILGGLPLAGFSVWLDFKTKQRELGASTHELEDTVNALQEALRASEAERARLTERMQNVETIVTSQAWDENVLAGPSVSQSLGDGSTGTGRNAESMERAKVLAQRMQS